MRASVFTRARQQFATRPVAGAPRGRFSGILEPITTRVLLIRHGATTLSAEDRFAGSTDVELSDVGRGQARSLGERLASERLAAVYASPMKRVLETARFVAAP